MLQNLSSAAVVIGALRVNYSSTTKTKKETVLLPQTCQTIAKRTGLEVIKRFSYSTEHEIYPAHNC